MTIPLDYSDYSAYVDITADSLIRDVGYPAIATITLVSALNYLNARCFNIADPTKILIASITSLGVTTLILGLGALMGSHFARMAEMYQADPAKTFWTTQGIMSGIGLMCGLWFGHRVAHYFCPQQPSFSLIKYSALTNLSIIEAAFLFASQKVLISLQINERLQVNDLRFYIE